MLASALADSLRAEGVRVAKLAYAGLDPEEFRNGVAQALALPAGPDTQVSFPPTLATFSRGPMHVEKVLLVIDEARIWARVLDEIEHRPHGPGGGSGQGQRHQHPAGRPGRHDAMLRRLTRTAARSRRRARLRPARAAPGGRLRRIQAPVAGADRELFGRCDPQSPRVRCAPPRQPDQVAPCWSPPGATSAWCRQMSSAPRWATRPDGGRRRHRQGRPALARRKSIRRIAYAADWPWRSASARSSITGEARPTSAMIRPGESQPVARTPGVANGVPRDTDPVAAAGDHYPDHRRRPKGRDPGAEPRWPARRRSAR
jgi:hypothetical protein